MFFEIDDIKRRHSGYFDVYNIHGWIDAPENTLSWNYARGFMASFPALVLGETSLLLRSNYKLMTTHYEPPANIDQAKIYAREMLKMDNFKTGFKMRL